MKCELRLALQVPLAINKRSRNVYCSLVTAFSAISELSESSEKLSDHQPQALDLPESRTPHDAHTLGNEGGCRILYVISVNI
jgi:hypothetical protein